MANNADHPDVLPLFHRLGQISAMNAEMAQQLGVHLDVLADRRPKLPGSIAGETSGEVLPDVPAGSRGTGYRITSEWMRIARTDRFLRRCMATVIPCSPFPGLHIGGLTVKGVYVNQGKVLEEIEVEYEDCSPRDVAIFASLGFQEDCG